MANILSAAEAAVVLRCETTDANMLQLLPMIDAYIKNATGRDWTVDTTIRPEAKAAGRMLITLWHENPAMWGAGMGMIPFGLTAALVQLEVLAMQLETDGVPDDALTITVSMPANGVSDVAVTASLVIVFNHEMAAASTAAVVLKDAAGATVATTNSLDATGKIMTINPDSDLTAASRYVLDLSNPADIYGMTLETDISFWTA